MTKIKIKYTKGFNTIRKKPEVVASVEGVIVLGIYTNMATAKRIAPNALRRQLEFGSEETKNKLRNL